MNKWTLPPNYIGSHWDDFYVFLSHNRDSDCLTESNFACGLKAIQSVMSKDPIPCDADDMATIQVVRENHWAVGWVEWIAIHESDLAAIKLADDILDKLDNYPVLNEDDYSRREAEEANLVWKNCYNTKERIAYIRKHKRQFEFHNLADMLSCVRGNYFAGYASELIN